MMNTYHVLSRKVLLWDNGAVVEAKSPRHAAEIGLGQMVFYNGTDKARNETSWSGTLTPSECRVTDHAAKHV